MLIIRAVAVGAKTVNEEFDATNTDVDGIRPYVKGLVAWLSDPGSSKSNPEPDASAIMYTLGTDYEIEYRERDVSGIQEAFDQADDADVLLCMSTFVGQEAIAWRDKKGLEIPIVVITSNPAQFSNKKQVCGVSALRPHLSSAGLRKFKKAKTDLTKIWLLNRQGYGPSDEAKRSLGSTNPPLKLANVKDSDDPAAEVAKIRALVPQNQTHGLFVLPADRFFGWAKEIQAAADASGAQGSALKTFWSTTDYPDNSYGGYGFPQIVCGRYMAERVVSIWGSDLAQVPDPAFITVDPGEIKMKPTKRNAKKPRRSAARKKR